MRAWLSMFLSGTLTFSAIAQESDLVRIDREVTQALQRWQVPGAAVILVRPDRVILLKGYGERERGTGDRVGPDTVFPLASCTKGFTSTALAMLVDERKVGWDDPVRNHLPDFHLADPHADALVTVRDLLCHRTGLAAHDYLWYRAAWSQDEMIRRVGLLPLSGSFRSSFAYQSIMYMAAGAIIAKQHPRNWNGFVSDRIFKPLGMTATTTTSTDAQHLPSRARGHRKRSTGTIEPIDDYPQPEPNAAGSIHTTARDLGQWLRFHLNAGRWRGKSLVSETNLLETHRPHTIIPSNELTRALNPAAVQLTYAMGWVVQDYRGVKVLAHAGMIDGFRCQLTLLPDHGLAIGLLNNLHATKMNLPLTNRLIDLLLALPERDWHGHFLELDRREEQIAEADRRRRDELRRRGRQPSQPLTAFVGDYEHRAYGKATITLVNEQLQWSWSNFERPLLPLDGDTFELRDVVLDVQDVGFVFQNGRVVNMKALNVEFQRLDRSR